jgi:hypothetical protein
MTNKSISVSLWRGMRATLVSVLFIGIAGSAGSAKLENNLVNPSVTQGGEPGLCPGPPRITLQPTTQTTPVNTWAVFNVEASSPTNVRQCPTSIQWQRRSNDNANFETISWAGYNILAWPVTSADRNAAFRAIVSNAAGSVISRVADLRVAGGNCAAPPVITRQPRGGTGLENGRFTFSVRATSSSQCPAYYQWSRRNTGDDGFELLPGANSQDLIWTPSLRDTSGAAFRVSVSNAAGSVRSQDVEFDVRSICSGPPVITLQPTAQSAPVGAQVTFKVRVTQSTNCLTRIQWQRRGPGDDNFKGFKLDTPPEDLIWTVTPEDRGAFFRASVGNRVGGLNSAEVELRVGAPDCTLARPTGNFQNKAFTPQNGAFPVEFDATPTASPINSTIGLSNGPQVSHTGFAALVRFNPSGNIDARNGGTYEAARTIPYSAGVKYQFRLAVYIPTHTYSVYVTPEGGTELTVGENFAFRTEQNAVTTLNSLGVWTSSSPSGSNNVCDFTTERGNGNVFIEFEAESMTTFTPFQILQDPAASGGQYLEVAPGNNSLATPPEGTNGLAYYQFAVPAYGLYRVWARVKAPTTADDSFWVSMNDGNRVKWNEIKPGADWHWANVHNADAENAAAIFNLSSFYFPLLSDTLYVAYREDGTKIDRIIITNNAVFVPQGVRGR